MKDIVKQGYVKFQRKNLGNLAVPIWNKKWLILRRKSCSGPLRLERYKDESTASVMATYGSEKKIIDLTKADHVERLPDSVKKHGVSIQVDSSLTFHFCVGSEMEAECWLSAIRDEMHPENRLNHESFSVYLMQNDYLPMHGDCTLQLMRNSIQLLDRYSGREWVSWPLSGIQRYGVERNVFNIEAGSSCPLGEGRFYFSGDESDFIYHRVHSLTQALARPGSNSQTPSHTSFSESNWGVVSLHELSSRRRGGGGNGAENGTNNENAYEIDRAMPSERVSARSNLQYSSRPTPSTTGNTLSSPAVESPYSVLPDDEVQADSINQSDQQYSTPRRGNGRQPLPNEVIEELRSEVRGRGASVDIQMNSMRDGSSYQSMTRGRRTGTEDVSEAGQRRVSEGLQINPIANGSPYYAVPGGGAQGRTAGTRTAAAASERPQITSVGDGSPYYSVTPLYTGNETNSRSTGNGVISGPNSNDLVSIPFGRGRSPADNQSTTIANPVDPGAMRRLDHQIRAVRLDGPIGPYYGTTRPPR